MPISITPTYAGLITLFFVFLSFRVIGMRRTAQVGLGDGGNLGLMRRLRVHGNFAEYVPLALVLMALAELQSKPAWILHFIGAVLIAGRLVHAYGVSQEPENIRLRVLGMALTFTALITGALVNLGLGGFAALLVGQTHHLRPVGRGLYLKSRALRPSSCFDRLSMRVFASYGCRASP